MILLTQQTFVLSLSPAFFCFPFLRRLRTVRLALRSAGQQADWLGINHHFVWLLFGAMCLERQAVAWTSRGDRREDSVLDSQWWHIAAASLCRLKARCWISIRSHWWLGVKNGRFVSTYGQGERATNHHAKPRWDKVIQHFNSPNCMPATNDGIHLMTDYILRPISMGCK